MQLVDITRLHREGRLLGRCALIKATRHSAEYGVAGGVVIAFDPDGELGIAIHGRLDDSYFVGHTDVAAIVDAPWVLDDELHTIDGAEMLNFMVATAPDTEFDPRVAEALARYAPAA